MALKGKIYSIARQHDDLNTNELFQSMIDKSAAQDTIVMDGRNIAAGSIFAEQIHAGAITANHIKSGAIETGHMDAGTIDVSVLKSSQLILPGANYGGVVINKDGLTMKSTGEAKLDIKLSSASGFNITDGAGNDLIDINPKTGNVKMQVNEMVIGGYSAATTKDVDDIEVGGRNLISDTEGTFELVKTNSNPYLDGITRTTNVVPTDKEYILSFKAKASSPMTLYSHFFSPNTTTRTETSTGYVGSSVDGTAETEIGTEWNSYWIKWTQNESSTPKRVIVARIRQEYNNITLEMKEVKLEKGNKATDWTPAPEDVEDSYTAVAEAKASGAETRAKTHADGKAETAETNAKDYAKKQVDDIEVGGRNLVQDSHFDGGNTNGWSSAYGTHVVEEGLYKKTFATLSSAARLEKNFNNLEVGEYTFTIFAKTPMNISWRGFIGSDAVSETQEASPDVFKRYSITFNVVNAGDVRVRAYVPNIPVGSVIEIDWEKLEKGNKATDWTPAPEDVSLDINKKTYNPVRYIRDWENGSTANTSSHWYEIQAYVNGENVARGKSVSGDTTSAFVTDGNTAGTYASGGVGLSYVQVDLGSVYYNVDSVSVWRYHLDGRRYHETKTEVSADGTNWVPIFDSFVEGEYHESAAGRAYPNTIAKSESLISGKESMTRLGDDTSKVTISGGNIKAGTISSENNYSWIDLDDGNFSFGDGRLVWNGSDMTVNGKISVSNIDGDIPKSKLASSVQGEIDAGTTAKTKTDTWSWSGGTEIDGGKIRAETITSNQIAAGSITAGKIHADAVTADKIATGEITADHLAADSITAGKISIDELSAISANLGKVTAGTISSNDGTSTINLTNGTFSFAGGKIGYNGSALSINADKINLDGKVTFDSLNTDLKSTVETTQEQASTAKTSADDAKSKTDAWSYEDTTEINGGSIRTGTLSADKITTGEMHGDRIIADTLSADRITGTIPGGKITLDGDVTVSGTFKVGNINISSGIEAGKITTGTMHGNRIQANTLSANRINTDTLSAITANLGTVTAGTLKSQNGKSEFRLNDGVLETMDTVKQTLTRISDGMIEQRTDIPNAGGRHHGFTVDASGLGLYYHNTAYGTSPTNIKNWDAVNLSNYAGTLLIGAPRGVEINTSHYDMDLNLGVGELKVTGGATFSRDVSMGGNLTVGGTNVITRLNTISSTANSASSAASSASSLASSAYSLASGKADKASSTNGYIKMEDGTLINWHSSFTLTYDNSNRLSGTWSWPVNFSGNPTVVATREHTHGTTAINTSSIGTSRSTNSVLIRMFNNNGESYPTGTTTSVRVIAIGRWFG